VYTLLEVELVTGKPHQIRAHLAGTGHPLIGDFKYGDRAVNRQLQRQFGLEHQLLHACLVEFPDTEEPAGKKVSGRSFTAPCPEQFTRIQTEIFQKRFDERHG
jgi:23S rRNA pseudouridine955/2504/2580 synthase